MSRKTTPTALLPVLSGFFIMGFVDVVGIATSHFKHDFQLSDTVANLLPMMVFFWFALCSIPSGIAMSRLGRRNTVLLSMGITAVAMLIPLIAYGYAELLVAFALLGIGNTILQVSLNPMVAQVVPGQKAASVLTLGQFVKAVSSFLGPVIAGIAASCLGNWSLILAFYAVVTLLSALWLYFSVGADRPDTAHCASFASTLGLFSDKRVRWLFVGILAVVGVDVGLNTGIPKLLMERAALSLDEAGLGTSLYFAARTAGAFAGAFLLSRFSRERFLWISLWVSVAAFVPLLVADELWILLAAVVLIGAGCSNVFSILFSYALEHRPEYTDEISALMIMGISGGVLVMPFMGLLADRFGQRPGMLPLLICLLYLLWIARKEGKSVLNNRQ